MEASNGSTDDVMAELARWRDSSAVLREKARRLSSQWPKRCRCCDATYAPLDWVALPFGYVAPDDYATLEARHCGCGSTLAVYLAIHDLAAE